MRLLLLGASGQIGARLAAYLRGLGFSVTGTSRRPVPGLVRLEPHASRWPALGRFDVVINAIGIIQEDFKGEFERIHLELPKRLAHESAALGNPRILHLSALGARPGHRSRFLATKAEGDRFLLDRFPGRVALLRPSIVCTPGTRLVAKLRNVGRLARFSGGWIPIPVGLQEARIQPLLMDDLIEVIVALLGERGPWHGPIDIGGPQPLTLGRLIALALRGQDLRLHPMLVPRRLAATLIGALPQSLQHGLLGREDLRMLEADNVVACDGRSSIVCPRSTIAFWEQQLGGCPDRYFARSA